MTPLLDHLQALLIAAQLPGLNSETLIPHIVEAKPQYITKHDPDNLLPAGMPIELEMQQPLTLLVKPFAGDLLDLILTLNLILDDLAPASRGNAQRLTVSAEALDNESLIVIITMNLRERIRYVQSDTGNLTINGLHYHREPLQTRPEPQPLNTIRYVG